MNGKNNDNLKYALEYAKKYSWAVFPVNPKTKEPLTPNGYKDAKKKAGPIKAWWGRNPDAAIGVATGSISGIIVIDLDIDKEKGKDGYQALCNWEKKYGSLPDTVRSITGRGGNHLFFKYADNDIRNQTGILDGVDVRGEGGFVIVPPSLHPNGSHYVWEQAPDDTELAEVDDTVRKLLSIKQKQNKTLGGLQVPEMIPAGERNDTMFKLACSLQSQGFPDDAIRSAVKATNTSRCSPPIEDKEIDTLINSALHYSKGELKQIRSGKEWREPKLDMKKDSKGNDTTTPKSSIGNMEEAIEYDEKLFGRILYNEMAYSITVRGNLPWHENKGLREWTDLDDSNLRSYLEKHYGLSGEKKVLDALSNVAWRNKIHPLKIHLEICRENWDGQKYIENLLPDMLGVRKLPYTIEVMKVYMLGAISRCYSPGCKFDYVPIFVGPQGKGKSTFLRYLAMNDAWFDDNFMSLEGKDSFEKLRGMWILEMAELQAIKTAKEIEAIKAFITSTHDNFRSPYERRTAQRPRSCVLAGTTNTSSFLVDPTGNRRFLPITCFINSPKINIFIEERTTKAMIAQAWGEAMHLYNEQLTKNGRVTLTLPKELEEEAEKQRQIYTEEDIETEKIRDYLDKKSVGTVICVGEIWRDVFTNNYGEPTLPPRKKVNEIHEIMKNKINGWKFIGQRRIEGFGRPRCYEKVSQ